MLGQGLCSDKLGPEAGWAGLTGLASRRVAGWAGPEPSLRHVRQAWPAGGQKKHFFVFFSTFSTKMADEPQGPPDRFSGPADMGGGGGGGRQKVGRGLGEGKSFSLEKRSELPFFGAEANLGGFLLGLGWGLFEDE